MKSKLFLATLVILVIVAGYYFYPHSTVVPQKVNQPKAENNQPEIATTTPESKTVQPTSTPVVLGITEKDAIAAVGGLADVKEFIRVSEAQNQNAFVASEGLKNIRQKDAYWSVRVYAVSSDGKQTINFHWYKVNAATGQVEVDR